MTASLARPDSDATLDRVCEFLTTEIAPQAERLDRDPAALRDAFFQLGERNLLCLKTGSPRTFRQFQMQIARYSGALAFLQTQHQSGAAFVVNSENETLKREYLPQLASGQKTVGVGFSHLRRRDVPVRADRVTDGYEISGTVPWVTGWGTFAEFAIGAELPDGSAVFGLVPLAEIRGEIAISEPMALAAMTSTQTVAATLDRYLLADDKVLGEKPPGWIDRSSRKNILGHAYFALGCARAGLDAIARAGERRAGSARESPDRARERLDGQLREVEIEIFAADFKLADLVGYEARLELRARAIELAGRCAQAAIVATGGAANILTNPAQRIYREALVYSVSGQTPDVMAATLDRLSDRG
ncbi:MAG: acyl-CoA dehydrogenase family protein [Geitlerinemataceae cyanobacterium]